MKINLIKSVDKYIGWLLVKVLTPRTLRKDVKPKSFLFIRPGGIGDALLLIPAIRALKHKYPHALITILAEARNAATFKLCPYVDRILLYDRPDGLLEAIRGRNDVVIDTEQWHKLSAVVARLAKTSVSIGYDTNERRKLFIHSIPYSQSEYEMESFFNLVEPLGAVRHDEIASPFLNIPEDASVKTEAMLGSLVKKPFVAIFPGASIPERRWGAERYAEVAKRLNRRGNPVVVVGGKEDVSDGERIMAGGCGLNLAGRTSLIETAAIIEKAAVLVSGDSGILHIGVGLGKPTVSLFGPGIAKKWAPRGGRHMVINKCLPCSPCTKFGYTPKCPIRAKCMAEITVDEVLIAVEKLLVRVLPN